MQQGDLIRALGTLAAASVGAGLALGGAAITGHLGGATTIEQFTSPATSPPASPAAPAGNLSVQEIYRQDAPGVVQITGSRLRPLIATGARASEELGSGFVIDKAGHIVTSNYVLGGARDVKISFSGNDELDATVVGKDPTTDVAVLQVDVHSRSLWPLPLGDSDQVQVGDPVVAIGNSVSLDRTATVGVVSAVQHGIDSPSGSPASSDAIQTDVNINHGNSGGPLINTRGQVIGITSQLGAAGGGNVGTGFAIPIDVVKSVVAQLIQTGKVVHPYLGIEALPVSASLASSFDLPSDYGLIVQSVAHGSAAAGAGLRAGSTPVVVAGESYLIGGDIIVAADGVPVSGEAQLREVIQTMRPGDRISLQIWRGQTKETVRVTLGRAPG